MFLPGAFQMLVARYWSRSSMRTCLTAGRSLARSFIMACIVAFCFSSSSSFSETSSLEKTADRSSASSFILFQNDESRQARFSVTWISRSQSENGIFRSSAILPAVTISSPGADLFWSPIRFW